MLKQPDPMALIKKHKNFKKYSRIAKIRVSLAVQVYKARTELGLTQAQFAKSIGANKMTVEILEMGETIEDYK